MSQSTPGRRTRLEKYVPFNNDPKGVGTRTNTIMPKDVARTADGFEDPEEFFRSPGSVIDPNRSMMSVMSKPPRTPGGRSTVMADTPMTGYTDRTSMTAGGPSSIRRGRMSDLDNDDDDGRLEADELLVDEDELGLDVPGTYFPDNNPPSVAFLPRSRLPPASPSIGINYDAVPSPRPDGRSPRKSSIGVGHRPPSANRTPGSKLRDTDVHRSSPLRTPHGADDVTQDEFDDALASEAAIDSSPTSGTSPIQTAQAGKRKSPTHSPGRAKRNKQTGAEHASDEDEEDGHETERPRKDRYSVASRRSNATRNGDRLADSEDERSQSDNDNGPSFHYDEGLENDVGFGGDDASALIDDTGNGGGAHDDIEDEDEDVRMEEEAMRAEEGSEEDQAEPVITKRKMGRPKASNKRSGTRSVPAKRAVTPREGSVAPRPKKTRISQIGIGSEDEHEDGIHGNFTTRRSKRQHFRPLEYWRNEKFEYQRGPGLPVIKEVITYPEEKLSFAELKKASRARSRSKKRATSEVQPTDVLEAGWDAKTDPTGIVMDFAKGQEVHRKVACPQGLLEPKMVKGGTFKYQKVFGEGAFMAAGVVYIPVGMAKAAKPSKDNCYVFYLIQGAVQVTVHRTSFVMAPGAQFLVPRGNEYSIQNISEDKEAQLFFAQARKIRRDEADTEVGFGEEAGRRADSSVPTSRRKSGADESD